MDSRHTPAQKRSTAKTTSTSSSHRQHEDATIVSSGRLRDTRPDCSGPDRDAVKIKQANLNAR